MIDGAELKLQLGDQLPSWELLAELGASASAAAPLMRCSRRTALNALKAASTRIDRRKHDAELALDVAISETHLKAALESSWPVSFAHLAERIDREGEHSVSSSERRSAVSRLPRGISVAHGR
jgi:hypothetical protein